jgi:hypothetical protein
VAGRPGRPAAEAGDLAGADSLSCERPELVDGRQFRLGVLSWRMASPCRFMFLLPALTLIAHAPARRIQYPSQQLLAASAVASGHLRLVSASLTRFRHLAAHPADLAGVSVDHDFVRLAGLPA